MTLLLTSLALAAPGTEIALVLDNSCSMIVPSDIEQAGGKSVQVPANDPERAAVLGTLIVEGLARGSADRLTVIGFGSTAGAPPAVLTTADAIRELPPANGTWFKPALEEARRRLEGSDRDGRLLLFFTDGAPSPGDVQTPAEGPVLAGLDVHPEFDSFVLGLYGSEDARKIGEPFLTPLARTADDLVFMNTPSQVVGAFTRGYARALGSKPLVGTLQPGETRTFAVPKYVVELLAVTASSAPGAMFTATFSGPAGPVPVRATGDNGCTNLHIRGAEALCDPPRRHYAVFRAQHDPDATDTWSLALPSAPGAVEFGLIYRYDLVPSLVIPPRAQVGDTVTVQAELLFRGQPFDDSAFFAADGFAVVLEIDGRSVPMAYAGNGSFTANWTPESPTEPDKPVSAHVRFRNQWMELSARRPVAVDGYVDLVLRPTSPVALGSWDGERGGTERCAEVDLTASTNADRVRVACTPAAAPAGFALTCTPVPGSEAQLGTRVGQPLRWRVCLQAPGCCDAASSPALATIVTFAGDNAHYAAGAVPVPVQFDVRPTGWLRCWWPVLAAIASAFLTIFIILGFIRPNSFEPAAAVRIAGSEAGLKRTGALTLRELPGGKRGFYRNARFCVDGAGDTVKSPSRAALAVEAGPGYTNRVIKAGGLERKSRSTGKWEAVKADELRLGVAPGTTYRLGSLFVKFE